MNVVLVGRRLEPLKDTASRVMAAGGRPCVTTADISQLADVERMAREAVQTFGSVHFLFNNAGIGPVASTEETTIEEWEWVLATNLWGVIHGIHVFLPLMQKQGEGHICATASESGLYGVPFVAAYNTSKFAVVGLMQSLARDLRVSGSSVTASVFCPGAIHTDIVKNSMNRSKKTHRLSEISEATKSFQATVDEVVREGMAPEEAAARLMKGIQRREFWIFSHDNVPDTALRQARAMASDHSLIDL